MVAPAGTAEIDTRGSGSVVDVLDTSGSGSVDDVSNSSKSFPATRMFTTGLYTHLSEKINPNWGKRWKSAAKASACILQYFLIITVGLIVIPATTLVDLNEMLDRKLNNRKVKVAQNMELVGQSNEGIVKKLVAEGRKLVKVDPNDGRFHIQFPDHIQVHNSFNDAINEAVSALSARTGRMHYTEARRELERFHTELTRHTPGLLDKDARSAIVSQRSAMGPLWEEYQEALLKTSQDRTRNSLPVTMDYFMMTLINHRIGINRNAQARQVEREAMENAIGAVVRGTGNIGADEIVQKLRRAEETISNLTGEEANLERAVRAELMVLRGTLREEIGFTRGENPTDEQVRKRLKKISDLAALQEVTDSTKSYVQSHSSNMENLRKRKEETYVFGHELFEEIQAKQHGLVERRAADFTCRGGNLGALVKAELQSIQACEARLNTLTVELNRAKAELATELNKPVREIDFNALCEHAEELSALEANLSPAPVKRKESPVRSDREVSPVSDRREESPVRSDREVSPVSDREESPDREVSPDRKDSPEFELPPEFFNSQGSPDQKNSSESNGGVNDAPEPKPFHLSNGGVNDAPEPKLFNVSSEGVNDAPEPKLFNVSSEEELQPKSWLSSYGKAIGSVVGFGLVSALTAYVGSKMLGGGTPSNSSEYTYTPGKMFGDTSSDSSEYTYTPVSGATTTPITNDIPVNTNDIPVNNSTNGSLVRALSVPYGSVVRELY